MAKEKRSISEEVCANIKKFGFLPVPVQALNDEAEATRYFGGSFAEFITAAKALGAKALFVEPLYLEEDEFFYDSGIEEDEDDCCDCGCGCDCSDCDCDCDCCCEEEECDSKKKGKKGKKDACKCETKKGKGKKDKCECKDAEDDEDATVWLDPEDLDGMDLSLLKPSIDSYDKYIGEECGVRVTVPGPDHLEVEVFTEWYDKFATLVDDAEGEIEDDPAMALKKMQENYAKEQAEAEG